MTDTSRAYRNATHSHIDKAIARLNGLKNQSDIMKAKENTSMLQDSEKQVDNALGFGDYNPDECKYCGGNCPNDSGEHLCDGYSGDIDNLYSSETNDENSYHCG